MLRGRGNDKEYDRRHQPRPLTTPDVPICPPLIECGGTRNLSPCPFKAITQLNESAKSCCWTHQLKQDGTYSNVLQSGTLAGIIASICVMELAKCDVKRIKICCRTSCGLYFYDTTRNRSALWHAENPCGWRTRSERRK